MGWPSERSARRSPSFGAAAIGRRPCTCCRTGRRFRWQWTSTAEHDFIGKVALENLRPGSVQRCRAWCGDASAGAAEATFRTAPDPREPARVRMLWGGDVGGQNVCRDAALGYPIFERMSERHPDFFVALGDMIYADDACAAVGRFGNPQVVGPSPARAAVPAFWEHWRYNRADPATQRFFATTPVLCRVGRSRDAKRRRSAQSDAPGCPIRAETGAGPRGVRRLSADRGRRAALPLGALGPSSRGLLPRHAKLP